MFTLDASVLMRWVNAKDPAAVVCDELLEAIWLKAIPLAVALRYGTMLVSLDDEHQRHLSRVIAV